MVQEISPEEYEKIVSAVRTEKSDSARLVKPILALVIVVLLCGGSFMAGKSYQKSRDKNSTAAAGAFGTRTDGGPVSFGNGRRPTVGEVTAVASDSITVKNDRSGENQTFKITSSTAVINNGAAAALSDVKTGNTVFIETDANDTSTASRIILNPATIRTDSGQSSAGAVSN